MTDDADVLAVARRGLETGPVCDPCLGRLVADRSFGLTNRERGRSLRVTLALVDDVPVDDLDPDEACWVCEDESAEERVEEWAERAVYALRDYEFDTFQVGTRVPPLFEENDRLLREDVGLDPGAGEPLKAELNREVGKRFGRETGAEVDFRRPDVQVTLSIGDDTLDVRVNSAFVYGRYRKLERDIPQTEWPCSDCNGTGLDRGEVCPVCDGSGYRYEESVEGLTAPVVRDAMGGESATFHGAGREDVDARMLGRGRPFVVEVEAPRRRRVDLDALRAEIDEFAGGAVEVSDLELVSYAMVERVKELDASKTYRMDVAFDEPVEAGAFADALDELRGATVEQRTPTRVDHRRADRVRTREVYDVEGELTRDESADEGDVGGFANDEGDAPSLETATRAVLELHGEGGLYVKELVSGDEGRTEPSLAGLLGVDAGVTALDVVDVEGEDEPFVTDEYTRETGDDGDSSTTEP